jgi:hypothetical protein
MAEIAALAVWVRLILTEFPADWRAGGRLARRYRASCPALLLGDLLDVVHQAEQPPLRVHFVFAALPEVAMRWL